MISGIAAGMKSAAKPESIGFILILFGLFAVLAAFNLGTEDAATRLREKGVGA
jgi:nitrate reductase NapE component